jgi:hypothetical protein
MGLHIDIPLGEHEFGTVEPEVLRCVHKLPETWDRKRELLFVKINLKLLEARSGDPTNKCFQVSESTSERETMEFRKCDRCPDWSMPEFTELPLYIVVGNGEVPVKTDCERLQLGHK